MKIREIRNTRRPRFKKWFNKEIMIILLIAIAVIGLGVYVAKQRKNITPPTAEEQKEEQTEEVVVKEEEQVEPYEPVSGGELHISAIKFNTLDPYKNKDKSVNDLVRLLYDSLFEFDSEYKLQNELASGYTIGEEGKTITVNLNTAARWQDGSRVLPEDVEFTVNYIKNNPNSPYYRLVSNIQSVKANGNSVVFTLNRSNALEVNSLTFPIISKKSIENNGFNVIANGMFRIAEQKKGKYIKLQKNESYYGAKPYINSIYVNLYEDNAIRKNMFLSRKTDIIESNYYELKDYEFEIYKKNSYQSNRYDFITYNFKKEFFSQAINRKKINEILSIDNFKDNVYKEELVYNSYPIFRVNYKDNSENVNTSNIQLENVVIVTDKDDPMKHRMAYVIQSQLSLHNIKSEVKGMSKEQLLQTIMLREYDIAVLTYNANYNDDIMTLLNNKNIFPIEMTEVQTVMENIYKSTSSNLETKYNLFLDKLSTYKFIVGVGFKKDYVVYDKNIGGFLDSTDLELYNGIEKLYIKPSKE